jgi:hypothetical protein
MAKAYLLSDVNARTLAPVAIFNNVGRLFNDTFAMLVCERADGAESVETATETGMLRVEGEDEPVGAPELVTLFAGLILSVVPLQHAIVV